MDNEKKSMRYTMIGDDGLAERERLEKFTGPVNWTYLKPHYQSGALLHVATTLDIVDAGMALVNDDKKQVQEWMVAGDLLRFDDQTASEWESIEGDEPFTALVVSPFVLAQRRLHD